MTHPYAQLKDAAMKPLLKASDEAEFRKRYDAFLASKGSGSVSAKVGASIAWDMLMEAGIAEKPLEGGIG